MPQHVLSNPYFKPPKFKAITLFWLADVILNL